MGRLRGDSPQNTSWVTSNNRKRRDVLLTLLLAFAWPRETDRVVFAYFCDHGSGTNSAAFADCPARENGGTAANPAVLLNYNGPAILRSLSTLALLWVNGQACGVDADVWSYDTVVANLDFADVIDGTVASNNDMVSNDDVVAVVTSKWCLDGNMATYTSNIRDWRCFRR